MVVMGSSGPFGMCWVGFVAGMLSTNGLHYLVILHAGLDLWLGCCQQMACNCPTSEPKTCHSPSISPINILLVHTIILQYVHMMLIDGCDGVIWPIWYVLGWICGPDVVKKYLALSQLLSPNPAILHPYH
jgi:hypothetical protein